MPNISAVKLANTFIERYANQGVDHLRLQKLAYFSYGWWLAFRNNSVLTTTKPQVWKLGPVFQSIYGAFAGNRWSNIVNMRSDSPFTAPSAIPKDGSEEDRLVDWVWGRYGGYSGVELSNMTHEPGTPWYETAKKHDFIIPRYTELEDHEIRTYFIGMAKKEGLIQ